MVAVKENAMKNPNNRNVQAAATACLAIMAFALAAILGKCSATAATGEIRHAVIEEYQTAQQAEPADIIAAAESRAIAAVIEAEKQYEQMDYEFFNADAEAYK